MRIKIGDDFALHVSTENLYPKQTKNPSLKH